MSCFATILKQCQTLKDIITIGTSTLIQIQLRLNFFIRQPIMFYHKLKTSKTKCAEESGSGGLSIISPFFKTVTFSLH